MTKTTTAKPEGQLLAVVGFAKPMRIQGAGSTPQRELRAGGNQREHPLGTELKLPDMYLTARGIQIGKRCYPLATVDYYELAD